MASNSRVLQSVSSPPPILACQIRAGFSATRTTLGKLNLRLTKQESRIVKQESKMDVVLILFGSHNASVDAMPFQASCGEIPESHDCLLASPMLSLSISFCEVLSTGGPVLAYDTRPERQIHPLPCSYIRLSNHGTCSWPDWALNPPADRLILKDL